MSRARAALAVCAAVALSAPAAASAAVREYPLRAGATPAEITAGPDGALWFAEAGASDSQGLDVVPGGIGRIGTDGALTEHVLPGTNVYARPGSHRLPLGIVAGADGNLWFTDPSSRALGRITPAGETTWLANPVAGWPMQIARSPDGSLWFPAWLGGAIGRLAPDGTFGAFAVGGAQPTAVAAAADGSVWFGAEGPGPTGPGSTGPGSMGPGWIGRMTAAGEVATTIPLGRVGGPESLAVAPDGVLWAGDRNLPGLLEIANGAVVAQHVPPSGSGTYGLVVGPDRAVWFAEVGAAKIGRWTRADGFGEFDLPSGAAPRSVAVGPDGAIWFTARAPDVVGRVDVPPDRRAPRVTARAAAGRRGTRIPLRYAVTDDRGPTREQVAVRRGTTQLWSASRPLTESAAGSDKSVAWRAPRTAVGTLRFCVRAWDAAGNASAVSCAPVRVR